MPVTATSAPVSLPTVAGTTSERRTSSERSEAASVPLPSTDSAIRFSAVSSTPNQSGASNSYSFSSRSPVALE
jgi:hypothetical protein